MPDLTRVLPEAHIPELPNPYFGKVRDCYDLPATSTEPARRILISSDRISAPSTASLPRSRSRVRF